MAALGVALLLLNVGSVAFEVAETVSLALVEPLADDGRPGVALTDG